MGYCIASACSAQVLETTKARGALQHIITTGQVGGTTPTRPCRGHGSPDGEHLRLSPYIPEKGLFIECLPAGLRASKLSSSLKAKLDFKPLYFRL